MRAGIAITIWGIILMGAAAFVLIPHKPTQQLTQNEFQKDVDEQGANSHRVYWAGSRMYNAKRVQDLIPPPAILFEELRVRGALYRSLEFDIGKLHVRIQQAKSTKAFDVAAALLRECDSALPLDNMTREGYVEFYYHKEKAAEVITTGLRSAQVTINYDNFTNDGVRAASREVVRILSQTQ